MTATTPTGDPTQQLRSSTELLWGERERPSSRGPKPGLRLDQIIDAAITVADAEGFDALSMRRVARELGVGTMSLYRYLPNKGVLLDLMLDRLSGPCPPEQVAGEGWRGVLETVARAGYQLYLAHPWLLRVNWTRPVFGPNTLAGLEQMIAGLAEPELTDQERISVVVSIDAYVTGTARSRILYEAAPAETGISNDEFWAHQYPVLERAMATGDYPIIAGLSEDAFSASWEETFEFGLQRLLDGIEALLTARRSRTS